MKEWTLERIALTALVALLSWNVYTTQEMTTDIAVIETKLETAISNRFTSSDAQILENKITRLEQWTTRLSERLADVESTIRNQKENME